MARIKTRQRSDGTYAFIVRWVPGGGRSTADSNEQRESFTTRNRAESFRLDVEHAGNEWPPGWVKGQGYVGAESPGEPIGATFADVAAAYLERCEENVADDNMKAYTVHRYRRAIALHMDPYFGHLPFADIFVEDIEQWLKQQRERGASPKSRRNRHGILFSIMSHGQNRMHLRADNPARATELPGLNHKEARQVRFFTKDEWRTLRSKLNEDVHLLCDVLLASGMRWGELSALRAGDATVNQDGSVVLHVVRGWSGRSPFDLESIDKGAGETRKYKLGPPKSRKSRFVVVNGDVGRRLAEALKGLDSDTYIFRRNLRTRAPWRYEDWHYERWSPAVRAAELNRAVTPHMLRHTCVVWSLDGGARIEHISEMLGHASIQITWDIYGGLLNLKDPTVANAMARAMADTGEVEIALDDEEQAELEAEQAELDELESDEESD